MFGWAMLTFLYVRLRVFSHIDLARLRSSPRIRCAFCPRSPILTFLRIFFARMRASPMPQLCWPNRLPRNLTTSSVRADSSGSEMGLLIGSAVSMTSYKWSGSSIASCSEYGIICDNDLPFFFETESSSSSSSSSAMRLRFTSTADSGAD